MKIPFTKSKTPDTSNVATPVDYTEYLLQRAELEKKKFKNTPVSKQQALDFYENGILGDAVDSVVEPLLQLKTFVYKKADGSEDEGSATLDFFINRLNDSELNYTLNQLYVDYLVTGNAYILIHKRDNKPYLWEVWPARLVEHTEFSDIDRRLTLRENSGFSTIELTSKGKNNFFSTLDGTISVMHIKKISHGKDLGITKLSSIHADLKVLQSLNVASLNQLENGTAFDLVISLEEDDKQAFLDIKKTLQDAKIGPSGERFVLLPREANITQNGQTNRDGDFLNLATASARRVYNRFNVPLALKFSDATTFNNVHTSKYMLITDASIPLWSATIGRFSEVLSKHFSEFGHIDYKSSEIPALQDKEHTEVLGLLETGILTVKEARIKLGFPEKMDDYLTQNAKHLDLDLTEQEKELEGSDL